MEFMVSKMNLFLPHRIYNLARRKSNEINHCDQFDKHSVRGSRILRTRRVVVQFSSRWSKADPCPVPGSIL